MQITALVTLGLLTPSPGPSVETLPNLTIKSIKILGPYKQRFTCQAIFLDSPDVQPTEKNLNEKKYSTLGRKINEAEPLVRLELVSQS